MGIADLYYQHQTARDARPCSVARIKSKLDDRDSDALEDMLHDPELSCNAVGEILRKAGHTIGRSNLKRHMDGECSCNDQPS